MALNATNHRFDVSLGCLFARPLRDLAARLDTIDGLSAAERRIVQSATRFALMDSLHRKLSRLLVLELNAARVENRLTGATAEERWSNFLDLSAKMEFWEGLNRHYPSLLTRTQTICGNICGAALRFGTRWAEDRPRLAALGDPGEMKSLAFGAGDTHRGGGTVAILGCETMRVVYKPRSVAPESGLATLIADLERMLGRPLSIRVPKVAGFEDHGWAEFIEHRHADGADALHKFYEGIGQWLALMRLLGGTDFHAENLIAHGATPVIVDCETLFTPNVAPFSRGLGEATDKALKLVFGTVLATGLLPTRGSSLGWRGIDRSGIGSLAGQQPTLLMPDILDAGTDQARFGLSETEILQTQNHPAAEPSLVLYWPDVMRGFEELSADLRRLDAEGALAGLLARFKSCRIRAVVRPTAVYAEIARMLWHPVSLHNEAPSRAKAFELLAKMAQNLSVAPSDPKVIEAEIDDMLAGDIPFYTTIAGDGVLQGPAGLPWLPPSDLVEGSLQRWREADLALEANFIRTTLVSAYVNDGWNERGTALRFATERTENLDARRRAQAAVAMRKLLATAIRGDDGTISWVAPTLTPNGFAVEVLGTDIYGGLSGIAMAAAAYVREQRAGRADAIDGIEAFLAGILKTLRAAEDQHARNLFEGIKTRPPMIGAYLGLGSQVWRHLFLSHWGMDDADGIDRAKVLAREIPEAAKADALLEVLGGRAGAIPALLALARKTGETEFVEIAKQLGDEICDRAQLKDGRAHWLHERWPEGLGGYAHGVTGVGWSLFKLADAGGITRHREFAQAAFAFEDSLFDASEQNWLDLRNLGGPKTGCAWCHGAVGIGLARLDLDPALEHAATRASLRAAANTAWSFGLGWNHCACHGAAGIWELLDAAIAAGEGPPGVTREQVLGALIASLEENGPTYGALKEAFVPGLLIGMAGVVYQLLRANPESRLPSFLIMDGTR